MDMNELKRHWDALGENDPLWAIITWDEKKGRKWTTEEFFEHGKQEIEDVLKYIETIHVKLERGRALDFGCGVGRLSQALATHFNKVVGVDISSSMIDLANQLNTHESKIEYQLNISDSLDLFADNSFDFIYSNITLQHMRPCFSKNYLKEFIRIICPNGLIIFQLPSHPTNLIKRVIKNIIPSSWIANYRRVMSQTFPRFEMYEIERRRLIRFLEKNGAKIVDVCEDGNAGQGYVSFRYCVTKQG